MLYLTLNDLQMFTYLRSDKFVVLYRAYLFIEYARNSQKNK